MNSPSSIYNSSLATESVINTKVKGSADGGEAKLGSIRKCMSIKSTLTSMTWPQKILMFIIVIVIVYIC